MTEVVWCVVWAAIAAAVSVLAVAVWDYLHWRAAERRRRRVMQDEIRQHLLECSRWEKY
jgi:hypothetical protein